MARVLFTVTYSIADQDRERYLTLARRLKQMIDGSNGVSYSVFEATQHNVFQEVYIYPSEEAFEAADDIQNDALEALMEEIYDIAKDKKVSYATFNELA